MRRSRSRQVRAALAAALLTLGCGPALAQDRTSLPDPYEQPDPGWAKLPPGSAWGDVVGMQQAPDRSVVVLHRCHDGSCFGRPEDPIRVFDEAGRLVRSFGAGMFVRPHGLWIDAAGAVWVSDQEVQGDLGAVVYKFDARGRLLMTIGTRGKSGSPQDGRLTQPTDIVTNRVGDIFISEGHGGSGAEVNRISRFDRRGRFVASFGATGTGPGQLRTPHNLAIDSQGRLFVADRQNNRLALFAQDGRFIAAWTQFGRPSGVFINTHDRLYVSDSQSSPRNNPGYAKGWWVGDAKTGAALSFTPDQAAGADTSGVESIGADRFGNILSGRAARFEILKRRPNASAACAPQDGLGFVCGVENAEDLLPIDGGRRLLAGSYKEGSVGFYLVDTKAKTAKALPLEMGAPAPHFAGCPAPDLSKLSIHGLDIRGGPRGALDIYAVNHGGRESVEVFRLAANRSHAVWTGCVLLPETTRPNAVVALSDGSILVTKLFDKREGGSGFREGKITGLVHRWRPGRGLTKVPNSELPGDNGLIATRDGKTLFVTAYGTGEIRRLPLDGEDYASAKVDFSPDNLRWAPDDSIFVTGQYPRAPDAEGPADWGVAKLDPRTMRVTPVLRRNGLAVFNSATSTVQVGRTLWFGTYRGDRIAYTELP